MRDGISDWFTITQWVVNSFQPTERWKRYLEVLAETSIATDKRSHVNPKISTVHHDYINWGDVFKKYDCDSSNSIDMSEVKNVGTWQKQTMYCTCLYSIVYPCCCWSWKFIVLYSYLFWAFVLHEGCHITLILLLQGHQRLGLHDCTEDCGWACLWGQGQRLLT